MNSNEPSLNQKEVAELLGLSTRQVSTLVDRGMPSRVERGRRTYAGAPVVAWYVAFKVDAALAAAMPADLIEARTRLTTAQARKAELELAVLEGQLVTVEDTVREVGKTLDGLRAGLLTFPQKHAHELVGLKTLAEVTSKLTPAIHELMSVLSAPELPKAAA